MCSRNESELCRTLVVSADLLAVRELAAFLRETCSKAQVAEDASQDLELAMVEAATNVVEHGYRDRVNGVVTLTICVRPAQVTLAISDMGEPAPEGTFSQSQVVELDALSGRGLSIIQACVDDVEYTSRAGCNRLILRKRLTG